MKNTRSHHCRLESKLTWHGRFGCAKTKNLTSLPNSNQALYIEDDIVDIVNQHEHLGVIMNKQLEWHDHIQQIIASTSQRAGLLRWMSRDLRPATIEKLFIYFLRPKLEYASPVWNGNLLARDALALERIQAAVARSILRASFYTPKTLMLQQLNWPSLCWRREVLSLTFFQSLIHTRPPPLDSCLFPFASATSTRSLRKPKQLILPRANTSKYANSFFFRTALVWNTLPANIQNITCRPTFKKEIEAHGSSHMSPSTSPR